MVQAMWYGLGLRNQVAGTGDVAEWGTGVGGDTIKVALLADTYTPDQDAHDFFDDVSAHEVSGTGYTAGGVALVGKSFSYTGATNNIVLDADDVTWPNSTITARYAVVYKDTGTASTSPLLGLADFEQNETSSAADFTVSWDAAGILRVTPVVLS